MNVIIVSSGAVGVGCQRLGLEVRPSLLAQKQALAAVGQQHLMRYYDDFFSALGLVRAVHAACGVLRPGPGLCCGLARGALVACHSFSWACLRGGGRRRLMRARIGAPRACTCTCTFTQAPA